MRPLDRSIDESFARPGFENGFQAFSRSCLVNTGVVTQMTRVPLPSISLPLLFIN
jgi:hypothetical protein